MLWTRIENQADLDDLMHQFGDFHDGILREVHVWTEHWVGENRAMAIGIGLDTRVRMVFQRQGRPISAIELLFEEVTRLNMVPSPEHYEGSIFAATLYIEGDSIFWAEEPNWRHRKDDSDAVTWISARKLSWRDASDWTGESLHYAVGTPPAPSA